MVYFLSYASLFLVVSFSFLPGHCQTFGSSSSRDRRQSIPRPLQTQSRQHRPMKSVVNYLGNNFLLKDGCPEPRCDPNKSECVRTVNMIRALYSHCAQGEEGQFLGCVTERIGRSGKITLPVYANMCSAMCYEADQQGETRVHRCPYEGTRQHDPNLQRLF